MYEVYIWILVLESRGKCKRAIHVNKKIFKKREHFLGHIQAYLLSGTSITKNMTNIHN